MKRTGPFRALIALSLCFVLIGVSACTNDSGDPLEYSSDPLLTGEDIGAADLTAVEFVGDLAVVSTTHHTGGRLSVIDLRTGQTRWSAADGDPILGGESNVIDLRSPHEPTTPVIRERDGGFDVYVPYRTTKRVDASAPDGKTGIGLAALAGEDGHGQWTSETFLTAEAQREDLLARPVFTDGDTVVAASGHPKDGGSPTTWVLDAESGDTRWTETHSWPVALGGEAVVVEASSQPDLLLTEEGPKRTDGTTPRGLSLKDGRPIWDLDDEFVGAATRAADSRHSVINGELKRSGSSSRSSSYGTVVISNDTGEEVDEIDGAPSCRASARMIACADGKELTTIGSGDDELEVSTPYGTGSESADWELLDVFDETIAVKDETEGNDRVQALDSQGKVRAESLPTTPMPAAPTAMSSDYLAVCDEAKKDCRIHAADGSASVSGPTSATASALTLSEPLPSSVPESNVPPGSDFGSVSGVNLVDDALVVSGDADDGGGSMLAAVDAETGKVRWSLDSSSAVEDGSGGTVTPVVPAAGPPRILDSDDGYIVLVGATSGGSSGIAAFNGSNGDLKSFHRLGESGADVDAAFVNGQHAAIDLNDDGHHETALADFASPQKPTTEWTKSGVEPVGLGEESVLVRGAAGSGEKRTLTSARLIGFDDADDVLWDSADARGDAGEDASDDAGEVEFPGEVMLESGLLIVNWGDGAEALDATDGTSLGAVGKRLSDCVAEADTVMCSSDPNSDLQRFTPPIALSRDGSALTVTEVGHRGFAGISGAYDGRYFVDEAAGQVAIDVNGIATDWGLSGRFESASDDGFALFMTCAPASCTLRPGWDVRRIE